MTEIVLVSHSKNLAEGIKELALQMAPDVTVHALGGTSDGEVGTDFDAVAEVFDKISGNAIVLFDLGSGGMTAQQAHEELDPEKQEKIVILNAALVEGAVIAAVQAGLNTPFEELLQTMKKMEINWKVFK